MPVATLAGNGGNGFVDGPGVSSSFGQTYSVAIGDSNPPFALVADFANNRLRRIALDTKAVSTLAGSAAGFLDNTGASAQFNGPSSVSISRDSKFAVCADQRNHRVRHIDVITGQVTTLAGSTQGYVDSTGSFAQFNLPQGVAITPDQQRVIVADTKNNCVRCIELPANSVTTLAGMNQGYADGPGAAAMFYNPSALAVDPRGKYVLVADELNHRIRLVELQAPYEVSLVAGSGAIGFQDGKGDQVCQSPCLYVHQTPFRLLS